VTLRLPPRDLSPLITQALEHEISNFSKERDKRVKSAQDKLKKAKVGRAPGSASA
jgi:hypothetical protein